MKNRLKVVVAGACLVASPSWAETPGAVLENYANIAEAKFTDSLILARALDTAIDALIANPSSEALQAARTAWIRARVPYQQTEVYRFGNAIVDDWEGKVNAWPLDEGLIDYVDTGAYGGPSDENPYAAINVIANPALLIGGKEIDASTISAELIGEVLHEADEIESNVSRGYHAIEFLLWGQDLHGTDHGAGERPWTDYAMGDLCTNDNCDRRGAYLAASSDLLVEDLEWMTAQWAAGGAAREAVTTDEKAGLTAMITGMGSLSYGELAGERIRLGLMLHDPEEEHDCFSDNTHNSHYFNARGIQNVYIGEYVRIDGTLMSGASLSQLVTAADPALDAAMRLDLAASVAALGRIKTVAEAGTSYDQLLASGNAAGELLIMKSVDALVQQTRSIERVATILDIGAIEIEGSDSLDNPGAVFQ